MQAWCGGGMVVVVVWWHGRHEHGRQAGKAQKCPGERDPPSPPLHPPVLPPSPCPSPSLFSGGIIAIILYYGVFLLCFKLLLLILYY